MLILLIIDEISLMTKNLSFGYKEKANNGDGSGILLENLNLELEKGELVCLLGKIMM